MTEEIITDYRQTVQRLQEELKEKSDMIFKLMDYVAHLEQENKELKENYCEKCKHLDLYMKYKSALEEIREVINQPCDNCKYNKDDIFLINTCSFGDCREGKLNIIETKINEVLEND